ncbi:MAG: armadillo/beta-catenin-like repeat family protein [Chthonomonadales bacterium]|nr:armadillo/beta-catenin-like repeat family protein [Chthonomonadales bacterium]
MRSILRIVVGIVLLCAATASQGQGVNSFGGGGFGGGGLGGVGTELYPAHAPERAGVDRIRALAAQLGPGVYHRMSGCTPPPQWGTGSAADVAADHLVRIGAPALPFVLPLAQTPDEATRALVIEILSRISDRSVVPVLVRSLHTDESARVRISAAEGLASSADPRAAPAFVPALLDPDLEVELFAVGALAQHPQESAIEPLAALMNHAAEEFLAIGPSLSPANVAERAAFALGAIGPPAYHRITALLASPDESVRKVAAISLTECNDRRAIPKLIELCAASENMTRLRAALALGRWSEPGSITTLTKMMRADGFAGPSAAVSLARLGGAALDPLFAAAADPHPALRQTAADSFFVIEDRTAALRLVTMIQSNDARVRQQALSKLALWKDARAVSALAAMAADPEMENRRQAIGLLGQYDSVAQPTIIPPLLTAMTDPHEWVRNQAAGALIGKRDKRIKPVMKRLLASPISGVPALAKTVLQHLPR